ncbi:MAG: hypothetical protein OQL28_15410 [Sedimenticola sp.]|nr:hypothetical protein [Sedimenticola sp.]
MAMIRQPENFPETVKEVRRELVQPDRVFWRLPMVSLIPEESRARLEG